MISIEDVKRLTELARLELSEHEIQKMSGELDTILEYVAHIKEALTENESVNYTIKNISRKDEVIHGTSQFTTDLLEEAPAVQDGFVKVKKII